MLQRGGAIPAQAGEPRQTSATPCSGRGHPRAAGGTVEGVPLGDDRAGAIPAQAGEPNVPGGMPNGLRGHPRAGGGTGVR